VAEIGQEAACSRPQRAARSVRRYGKREADCVVIKNPFNYSPGHDEPKGLKIRNAIKLEWESTERL